MPVQYTGVGEEHLAVRTKAGLFDVSHMGEVSVEGPGALSTLQRLTSNDVSRLAIGQVQYAALTTPQGAFVDDILVHRRGEDRFFLCVNASNTTKDFEWIASRAEGSIVKDVSGEFAQLAVQGPCAAAIVQKLVDRDLRPIRNYWFFEGLVLGVPAIVARTGYTGEDGFELYLPAEAGPKVWDAIRDAGRSEGIVPAGLAARDTLRLEAKMALYGNDIDETTSVLEADLSFILKLGKGDFLGRDALVAQEKAGLSRILVGFELRGEGIARHGCEVIVDGSLFGHVTSGTRTPYLKKSIGLAYLPPSHAAPRSRFEVQIRGRSIEAEVVPTPFYKRKK